VRLVLCDDNRIFCEALAVALEARGHQALAIATTADEGVAAVARHQPDACLLDFRFHEGGEGVGAARAIRDKSPGTAVLVVSDSGSRVTSLVATQAGVAGFVGKDQELDRIATALDAIAARRPPPRARPLPVAGSGRPRAAADARALPGPGREPSRGEDPLATLTPREAEVLQRITAGQGTKAMAREMSVTTETLRTYVKNVLAKLGAHSRLEAAALVSGPAPGEPGHEHPLLAALTPREREVLAQLTRGAGLREVAKQLHMSLKTVNTHLHNLRGKLGVHSTLEAVALARSAGRPVVAEGAQAPGELTAD
jgi:DNA-binding NarL/FixJ family response regulator